MPVSGRGSLPFALVHGDSLVAAASWALAEAGAELLDASVRFEQVRGAGRPLVLHDPLCPLTPVAFLRDAAEAAAEHDALVVGFRPVTDTVKRLESGRLGQTVDRDRLRAVTSPVVVPAGVVAELERWPDLDDFPRLVAELAPRGRLQWLEAPPTGRRVRDAADVADLEALSRAAV